MMENIKRKRAAPKRQRGLHNILTDPLGAGAYTEPEHIKKLKAARSRKSELEEDQAIKELNLLMDKLSDTAK